MNSSVDECEAVLPADGSAALAGECRFALGVPRLLVSVRSAAEAAAALQGGADVLDVKAPERGSLGRPPRQVVRAVLAVRDVLAPHVPVSIALGELAEWTDAAAVAEWLPPGIGFAKVGLAGQRDRDWTTAWQALREAAPAHVAWVAVAYADVRAAAAPDIADVIAAAVRTHFAGVLVDTYSKREGRLLDHLAPAALGRHARGVHSAGLFWAVAGRLSLADLPRLSPHPVDVVAVRSAVCIGEDRREGVEAARVARFRTALQSLWADSSLGSSAR